MEILYYLTAASLLLFMVLATYDGFYLHIWRYQLYAHPESRFEHKIHAIRAVLFPLIVWTLVLNTDSLPIFLIGLALVVADTIVLAVDAYSEKESRVFMGGLPRWEYIIHLFSNAFHYATIFLILGIKLRIVGDNIMFNAHHPFSPGSEMMYWVGENAIPGAIVLAVLHLVTLHPGLRELWQGLRVKVKCC
ncbi:MAG: hypothetical protein AB3N16_00725 [Flavobacteriaceae bacterium]